MKKVFLLFFVFLSSGSLLFAQNPKLGSLPYPEMITVQGGTFEMGDKTGTNKDSPVHSATVKTFKIASTETTVAQWRVFCVATNRKMPDIPSFGWVEERPIVNVSYDDAVAYCYWLNEKGGTYRLPTDAEWEFAAKGGTKSKGYTFAGSNNLDSVAWYGGKGGNSPKPVATKMANELGLYDMAGNIYEWVADGYDPSYYASDRAINFAGNKRPEFYTMRSGGFDNEAFKSGMYYKNVLLPYRANFNKGFRVASDN